jgi:SDR family mycofactocin-dependent oxidoreductase
MTGPSANGQWGRVAVVTGASRGIGSSTVCRLAADGWSVVAVDRASDDPRLPYPLGTESQLAETVARALAAAPAGPTGPDGGPRVVAKVADTTDEAALAAAVEEAEERFGGVDAMVAVAGVIAGGVPLWEMPADALGAVLGVDLGGPVAAARVGVPAMLRRPEPRSGRFLAVASVAGIRGFPLLTAYGAAKAGVVGLVRGLAIELAGTGITANAIAPGSTDTAMLVESARLYRMADRSAFGGQQVVRRLLDPAEVADVLVWLAGPAGAAITGAVVPVDGGLSV